MPWEITIVNYDGNPPASYRDANRPDPKPLGSKSEVVDYLKTALPVLAWTQTGREMPPNLAADFKATFSPAILALMFKQKLTATFDGEDFSVELYGFEQDPVPYFHAEIRGDGNVLPFLARLALPKHWSVASDQDGSFVDLNADGASQWEKFRAWRDRAVKQTKKADRTKDCN